jgi:hypothetical protein
MDKFSNALKRVKPNTECSWSGDISTEDDFKKILWVTGVHANGTSITTTTNPHSEITWTKIKADMDKQDAFVSQEAINKTAQAYLTSTDWYSIREAEGGTAMPSDVKTKRATERAKVVSYEEFTE